MSAAPLHPGLAPSWPCSYHSRARPRPPEWWTPSGTGLQILSRCQAWDQGPVSEGLACCAGRWSWLAAILEPLLRAVARQLLSPSLPTPTSPGRAERSHACAMQGSGCWWGRSGLAPRSRCTPGARVAHGAPAPSGQAPACSGGSQSHILTTQSSLRHHLGSGLCVHHCPPKEEGDQGTATGAPPAATLPQSAVLPENSPRPRAGLGEEQNSGAQSPRPRAAGLQLVIKGSLLPLPRPRSCGRKTLGAPCWSLLGTDLGGGPVDPGERGLRWPQIRALSPISPIPSQPSSPSHGAARFVASGCWPLGFPRPFCYVLHGDPVPSALSPF